MIIESQTREGFVLKNKTYKVECNFDEMSAAIFKNGELEHYRSLKFPNPYYDDNLLQIIDVGENKVLFEVVLEGTDINERTNQLMRSFGVYLKDDIVCGHYTISGVTIEKIL